MSAGFPPKGAATTYHRAVIVHIKGIRIWMSLWSHWCWSWRRRGLHIGCRLCCGVLSILGEVCRGVGRSDRSRRCWRFLVLGRLCCWCCASVGIRLLRSSTLTLVYQLCISKARIARTKLTFFVFFVSFFLGLAFVDCCGVGGAALLVAGDEG